MAILSKPIYFVVILFSITLILTFYAYGEQPQSQPAPLSSTTLQSGLIISAPMLYATAKQYLDGKEYQSAIIKFSEFKKNYPNHKLIPYCNYHLAECYLALKDFDQAETALSAIDIKDRKTAEYFKENGWAKNAAEFLNRYLLFPLSKQKKAEVYLQQGIFLQILNDGLGARLAFDKTYQLAPESEFGKKARYYTGISLLYEQIDSGNKQAYEIFSQLANQYPNDPVGINSQFFLTISDWRWLTPDNTIIPYEQFIRKYPKSPWTIRAYFHMGIIEAFNHDNPAKGLSYFRQSLDLLTTANPAGDDPPTTYWLEELLIQSNLLFRVWYYETEVYLADYSIDSALELAKVMQSSYPPDHGVYQFGKLIPLMVLQQQNKFEELLSQADIYLAQCPEAAKKWSDCPGKALYLKAFTLDRLSRNTEAIAVYDQMITQYPESEYSNVALFRLGKLYDDINEFEKSAMVYDRCLTLFPRYMATCYAYVSKAEELAKLDRYREALATLDLFFNRSAIRYDCRKDALELAIKLRQIYQRKLGITQRSENE